ncbi:hypothetical protein SAMN05216226_11167 [Halovenus aranensis]|jgi:hypothetical protein|uniref:Short C-terminal domain-containing protein n=1 Tax=Halovenus aranensis TaxID=890420 RepID=A0A1G8XH16_9EURY|nr:hypothetical protein [Halovenus aranensis]SDJ89697.1 hypothetical protein SAMN05216226_11167 [Halovenus aranensis]
MLQCVGLETLAPTAEYRREADQHETLTAGYAAGELGDAEFEKELDALSDSERKVDPETVDTDRSHADESDQLESRH